MARLNLMSVRRPNFRARHLEGWERGLAVLWLAQATSALGFSFVFPFIPLFVQDLGVQDVGRAALWSGIAGGLGGLMMMVSGPFWGILGDRFGRKKNVLRALIGSALILGLTGLVTDVYQLMALRVALGLVSGTWVTVMALASAMAPKHRAPFAVGVVQSASFVGFTLGPVLGGLLADSIGFRGTFFVTGALGAFAGLMVLLFVRERFHRSEGDDSLAPRAVFGNLAQLFRSRAVVSVLLLVMLVQMGPTIMMPVLPVFIGTLSGSSGASSAGIAFSIMGFMGVLSSLAMTRLAQRAGIVRTLIAAFVGAGSMYLPLLAVSDTLQLYLVLAGLGFFSGGLTTLVYALVGTTASSERLGTAYGAAQSASAFAWGSGPLLGGIIAASWGLREVFLVNSLVLFA
ncbi:MAG: MFS transporter, partial [SAR202 cluster bacterium]|nr:MFS transporter [SAR202 cluster bacterium]